jgi:hypothetical protein
MRNLSSSDERRAIRGTCHCGAVEIEITLKDGFATARRCD